MKAAEGATRPESPGGEPPCLPEGFLFGVSDSGFQSEGGYNGAGDPENNWAAWERNGRAEHAGAANEFWTRYPEHFDKAIEAGCGAYRLSVEWARCLPARAEPDPTAIERYVEILRACRDRGLEPVVALHHFTQPAWLRSDFWLDDDAPRLFAQWVELIVPHLAPYCTRWTTINEINALAIGSFLIGYFPPGRRLHPGAWVRAVDNMLTAHVLAYDIIHRIRPDALVGTSTFAFWCYDVDRILIDVLCARSHGIDREDLTAWLGERRATYHSKVLGGLSPVARTAEASVHSALRAYLRVGSRLERSVDAVYASRHDRCLDVTQLNYYDPRLSNYLHLPGRMTGGRRHWGPDPEHWEHKPGPEHLASYLRANSDGPDIWILENGLCNPVIDGRPLPRPDGWDRPTYLREHLRAVVDAIDAGTPVSAYFHWALFDNYQWGEYGCCYGLYGVNRDNAGGSHGPKFLEVDSMGDNSAGVYRRLSEGLRAGDRSVLA